jgi:hypothetical protein
LVSANTFDVLGSGAFIGRTFRAEDDEPKGPLMLNDVPVEVIAVMPDGGLDEIRGPTVSPMVVLRTR